MMSTHWSPSARCCRNRRDTARGAMHEFALSYQESSEALGDSVFLRVIRESLWKLADITDKSQLEWREVFQDLRHHGVYQSGEVVGLGNGGEKCGFTRAI